MCSSWGVVYFLGKKESCWKSCESAKYAYTYDNQIKFPIQISRKVLNDLNHDENQKFQGCLILNSFNFFPLAYLGSYLGVVGFNDK